MSQTANTLFSGNKLASDYHRVLGRCCYYIDNDQTELSDCSIGETMKEYTYDNGKPKTVALIDFKYPGDKLSDEYPAIQYQIYSSEEEYKRPIPFFIVVYYLDSQHPVKMYYVIPANRPARSYFDSCGLSDGGAWMSLRHFSKFQHALRGKAWNGDEVLNDKNCAKIGLPEGTKLKDLSSKIQKYKLPYLNFSWLTKEISE